MHFSVLGSYIIICLSELITYLYHVLCSCYIAFHVHVHVSVRFHISYQTSPFTDITLGIVCNTHFPVS